MTIVQFVRKNSQGWPTCFPTIGTVVIRLGPATTNHKSGLVGAKLAVATDSQSVSTEPSRMIAIRRWLLPLLRRARTPKSKVSNNWNLRAMYQDHSSCRIFTRFKFTEPFVPLCVPEVHHGNYIWLFRICIMRTKRWILYIYFSTVSFI